MQFDWKKLGAAEHLVLLQCAARFYRVGTHRNLQSGGYGLSVASKEEMIVRRNACGTAVHFTSYAFLVSIVQIDP
jgi:hypothetical protein